MSCGARKQNDNYCDCDANDNRWAPLLISTRNRSNDNR